MCVAPCRAHPVGGAGSTTRMVQPKSRSVNSGEAASGGATPRTLPDHVRDAVPPQAQFVSHRAGRHRLDQALCLLPRGAPAIRTGRLRVERLWPRRRAPPRPAEGAVEQSETRVACCFKVSGDLHSGRWTVGQGAERETDGAFLRAAAQRSGRTLPSPTGSVSRAHEPSYGDWLCWLGERVRFC